MDAPVWASPDHEFGSADDLLSAYDGGFPGTHADPEGWQALLASQAQPYYTQAGIATSGAGEGKVSLPFRCVLAQDPNAYEERQTTGDCASHAGRNAADTTRAAEIAAGEREEWVARGATEGIYGSRGSSGQGMSCAQVARFLSTQAGVLLRKRYPFADLSKYNGSTGARWGGAGLPPELVAEGKLHPIRTVALIRSVEEARDALACGYGVCVCSNVGFSAKRDADGFAAPRGTWYHAMAWIGCDDASTRKGFLVQNSWGTWNDGPTRHDQPTGSFWITPQVAKGMIAQGGAYTLGNAAGFPLRTFKDWGSSGFL